jgi:protein-disulfide isomerase
MGRRSARKQALRRARRQQTPGWAKALPYIALGSLATIIVVGLFALTVSTGGSSAHPDGYEPPMLGDANAPVEFVLWEDFQCPFCKRFETETFQDLKEEFADTGKVRFVWRNFQRYGSESINSGVASNCAGEQGKFWEFKDIVFQNQNGIQTGALSDTNLRTWSSELGLDMAAYDSCFVDRWQFYRDAMAADRDLAREMGINGTPGFHINGEFVGGAQPTATLATYINNAMAGAD